MKKVKRLQRRVTELLQAMNVQVERRREAERLLRQYGLGEAHFKKYAKCNTVSREGEETND